MENALQVESDMFCYKPAWEIVRNGISQQGYTNSAPNYCGLCTHKSQPAYDHGQSAPLFSLFEDNALSANSVNRKPWLHRAKGLRILHSEIWHLIPYMLVKLFNAYKIHGYLITSFSTEM